MNSSEQFNSLHKEDTALPSNDASTPPPKPEEKKKSIKKKKKFKKDSSRFMPKDVIKEKLEK